MSHATPGPWTYAESQLSREGNLWFIVGVRQNGAPLKKVAEAWTRADARLISATPDLLFALKNLLAMIDGELGESHDCSLAYAAIAKAEGLSASSQSAEKEKQP